ncbi:MAG: low molecular weight protein-tyrosine-phosphatase [Chloroflexota bacterium]
MTKVLFVCLGNICRSPMAEAVFQRMVVDAGLEAEITVDSAGTSSYHVGERAHPGTRRVLARHGIAYEGRARQIRNSDVTGSDTFIVAMDQDNVADLQRTFGEDLQVTRLLEYAQQTDIHDVPDPYYSDNFDLVYRLIEDGCRGLLTHIRLEQGV